MMSWLYLLASVLLILGLQGLTDPRGARRGIQLAALGMLAAVGGTLLSPELRTYVWIVLGILTGGAIGAVMAIYMPMTAMPQRIALSHAFGALAAVLVGVAEHLHRAAELSTLQHAALGFEVLFGSLTVTGSLMAFAKLQELLPTAPIVYPFQNATNLSLFGATVLLYAALMTNPTSTPLLLGMAALGLVVGVLMVLPIGGADMPVVVSLLNSYAGLAASATGFALGNQVLIIAGALDGASGFILSILMCRAMNRSFTNVLFGAFGTPAATTSHTDQTIRSVTLEDAAVQLAYARKVVVVPGYGMAVSQAQQTVRELAEQVQQHGGEVEFAIHPVAGRMPGHMNVLLAEANIPYDQLKEMEQVNPEFPSTDVALVVGANDVVNPAAREDKSSPLYGMPILDADRARSVIVLKRSMKPGFAGVDNPLFALPNCALLFGDARETLGRLVARMKAL
ncbi:MAG: NAD(P) transhydrogenase subunit beta [Candidatus Xenobia bacterium]